MKNKIRKITAVLSASVLSLVSLLAIALPQAAHATSTGTYYQWTGAASTTAGLNGCTSNCWSVFGNWEVSTDGGTTYVPATSGQVPNNTDNSGMGDNLVFDNTNLTAASTINNDISGLIVDSLTFQGNNTNYYSYIIDGNAISLNSGIQNPSINNWPNINVNISLLANQTFSGDNGLDFGTGIVNLGANNLTISGVSLGMGFSGTGSMSLINGGGISSSSANNNYSGAITETGTNSQLVAYNPTGFGTGAITISGGELFFVDFQGATLANNLTLGNGATIVTMPARNGDTKSQNITLGGNITLTGNVTVDSRIVASIITITGAITGNYTITPASGDIGTLVINSSNNQSATSNQTTSAPAQTISVAAGDNQPSLAVNVGLNTTEIIDGIRGDTTVQSGGILKGNGVLGSIYAMTGSIVAPGHSPGCLTTTDNQGLTINGTYQVYIDGTTPCTQYSSINVNSGQVILSPEFNNTTSGTLALSFLNGFIPKTGQTFEIINNQANQPVVGTFTSMPEGSTFTVSGVVFKITYKGGNGNSVVLTVVSVPKTPDTGFGLISSNSSTVTFIATTVAALSLVIISRYYSKLNSKK